MVAGALAGVHRDALPAAVRPADPPSVFVENRWAASRPSWLSWPSKRRRVQTGGGAGTSGACRLRVDLDEFAQVFEGSREPWRRRTEAPSCWRARSDQIDRQRSFSLVRPAPSANAVGGVLALRGRAPMGVTMNCLDWLGPLGRSGPPQRPLRRVTHPRPADTCHIKPGETNR